MLYQCLAGKSCHVTTVVSDRSRATTGFQTRRIHLFGHLVNWLPRYSWFRSSWVRIPLLAKTLGGLGRLDLRPRSMVTIRLDTPYRSAYRQIVVLARRGKIVTW